MKPRSAKLLEDIRDAAGFIRDCVRGKTLTEYRTERMLRQAVERNFEIIGEALKRLTEHDPGYDLVDHALVWSTIETRVPVLLKDVESLLVARG
jgi:uncharacterized protein with HEPN domain